MFFSKRTLPLIVEPLEPDDAQAERDAQQDIQADWLPSTVDFANLPIASPDLPSTVRDITIEPLKIRTERRVRGRGRPRVLATPNDSAIEKRRAQVRNAQRTYQTRKDTAAHSKSQRSEELLKALSALSGVVEDLLITATECGVLEQRDDLGTHMRTLWSAYDATINQPCINPELRSLQIKNQQRMSEYESRPKPRIERPVDENDKNNEGIPIISNVSPANLSTILDPNTKNGGGTTIFQSYTLRPSIKDLTGRTLYDLVAERQAKFHS